MSSAAAPVAPSPAAPSAGRPQQDQRFWAYVKRQYAKNKLAKYSLYLVYFLLFTGVFADFIANEKPIIAKYRGDIYFPVLKEYLVKLGFAEWPPYFRNVKWNELEYDFAVWPPVPYLPQNLDFANSHSVGPFEEQVIPSKRWTHWLGTDELGRDVLAGMIHGTRTALLVGVVSMSIASLIGILLGSLAGFFGDSRLRMSRARLFLNILFFALGCFYAFGVRAYTLGDALGQSIGIFAMHLLISFGILAAFVLAGNGLTIMFKYIPYLKTKVAVPLDLIISRAIEVIVSIPQLFLIISIVAIAKPSIFLVMAVIGLVSWTSIARFIRAELLKVRNLEYIEAAQALGFANWRILVRHAIPNALSPVLISIAFGIASSILTESTLSFLGIGVSADTVTWGSLLTVARQAPNAWWLAIFPGFAIFITVTIFNLVGEGLTDALDPRQKR